MTNDEQIRHLMVRCLHAAIRRQAVTILQAPDAIEPRGFHDVERLMRMAVAMLTPGVGVPPKVYIHRAGLPPQPGTPPELLLVDLTDLLAARVGERLGLALEGDPAALAAIEEEAAAILATEDIQYR